MKSSRRLRLSLTALAAGCDDSPKRTSKSHLAISVALRHMSASNDTLFRSTSGVSIFSSKALSSDAVSINSFSSTFLLRSKIVLSSSLGPKVSFRSLSTKDLTASDAFDPDPSTKDPSDLFVQADQFPSVSFLNVICSHLTISRPVDQPESLNLSRAAHRPALATNSTSFPDISS